MKNVEFFENETNHGCIMVLYSAIFSRTLEQYLKIRPEIK